MSKVILLSRVSTAHQDLTQQTEKVLDEIKKDGYKPANIITIEDKESAVLLSEEERNGLNKLKHYIETEKIDAVYTYEVSRISRQPSILYSIRDYLIRHKVQLVILNPYMKMLKDDGTLSETANIFFGIFSSMAENEGFIRKARMRRGVEKKRAAGLHWGGSIAVGYSTDKQDRYIIDPHGAEYVRRIFNEYVSGKSVRQIARDLQNEGWRTNTAYLTVVQSVLNILHREYYTGNDGIHPAIISQELYDQAQTKCEKARVYAVPKDEVMLLKGLIYDRKSGFLLSGNKANGVYYSKRVKGPTVSWLVIDPIIWIFVEREHRYRFVYERESWLKDVDKEIKRNNKIIDTMTQKGADEMEIIERIEERYIEGKITKQKANELEEKHHRLIFEYTQIMKKAEEDIKRLESDRTSSSDKLDYDKMSIAERIQLVRNCIDKIIIERQTRFIVSLEIHMKWYDVWDFEINTREKIVLKESKRPRMTLHGPIN